MVCDGVRREVCLTCSGGSFEELRRGISSATGCRATGMKEAIGGNLWEQGDEWSVQRAHAAGCAASPLRESARRGARERAHKARSLYLRALRRSGGEPTIFRRKNLGPTTR